MWRKVLIIIIIVGCAIGVSYLYLSNDKRNSCLDVYTMNEIGEFDLDDPSNLWLDGDFYANYCEEDIYECNDFCTQDDAQKVFEECNIYGDIHNLDIDNDGIACESLRGSAQEEDPDNVKTDFYTYNEAIEYVRNNPSYRVDTVDTSKSSWVRGAEYYSLEGDNYGYVILNLNGKEYIHKNVPLKIWESFKEASSFGSYYNQNIKGKYQLYLK